MSANANERGLRVLVAGGQDHDRLEGVASAVAALGHAVIAGDPTLANVAALTRAEHPDLAMVIVGESREALEFITKIVREAACPVIAIIDAQDRSFIKEAAKQGIFAYISDGDDPEELQSEIDVALSRFTEYHELEGAFGRRAITERAKGILMERHSIGEEEAFKKLRDQARRSQRKIVDIAEAVLASHTLLPSKSEERAPTEEAVDRPRP